MYLKPHISVLVADDHPIFRRGLVDLIEQDGSYKIIYEAVTGNLAIDKIRALKPDIAIMDIGLPEMTGIDVIRIAHEENLPVKIVVLTMYNDEEYFFSALENDVLGYLLKDNTEDELLHCLKSVVKDKLYISPSLSGLLVVQNRKIKMFASDVPSLKNLTPSEKKILKLIAENKTNKEIGKKLFISHKTVENHRTHIVVKLGFKGRNKLLQFALENKSLL